uniref:DEAD/DEAH box helicase n=1 Tax=Ignisphaera aggregans TaxID=334771 RepID=A0A7C2ZMK2_9CREN
MNSRGSLSISIPRDVVALLNRVGFAAPTAIQSIAIPKILTHDLDVVIAAPTGSGKTEAAVVPLLYRIARQHPTPRRGIKIIYITPLRALNRDLHSRIEKLAQLFGLRVAVWHGDTPSKARKQILKSPPDIVITTPESLQILLIKKDIRDGLKHLYAIVIDEAQELVSSERGSELTIALERIDSIAGRHIRRILISSPIGDVDAVAKYFFSGRRYDVAYVAGIKKYEIDVVLADGEYKDGMIDLNAIYSYICRRLLAEEEKSQILIFSNTRTSAEELGFNLTKCLGESVALHHGSLSRDIREVVETMFKRGNIQVVIATSSLELGIDIGGVDLVIQYLSPRQALRLIQRVGRAGHRESSVSKGIVVVPPLLTEIVESITLARRASKGLLEKPVPHIEPLDVVAHQIVGIMLEKNEVTVDELYSIISRAAPFNSLTISNFEKVLELLNSIGMIKCDRSSCRPTKKGMIYYLTTNMIPDTMHYITRSILDGRPVGLLDEDFVLTCNEGDVVVLAGKLWEVVSVDLEKKEVYVSPIKTSELAVLPKWVGELIPVYRNVARETCSIIRRICECDSEKCLDKLFDEYSVNPSIRDFLRRYRDKICRVYPRDDILVVEVNYLRKEGKTMMAFYTCLGSKASEAFSLLVSHIIRNLFGVATAYKSHQLGTVVLVSGFVDKNAISKLIKKLYELSKQPHRVEEMIENEIKNTTIFKYRLVSVAKKFGIISKDVESSEIRRIVEGLLNIDTLVAETLREIYTEKIDTSELLKFLGTIAKRGVKVFIRSSPSPFIEEMTSLGTLRSLIKYSLIPKNVEIEIVKRRLLDKELTAFCTSCYRVWSFRLIDMVNKCSDIFSCFIECASCGSRAVTLVDGNEEARLLKKALEKIKRSQATNKPKLLANERDVLEKHKKLVDFLMSHGIAGAIAIQGIGIGIETAKRVLARSSDLDSLITNIVEHEKLFFRTSKYWRR